MVDHRLARRLATAFFVWILIRPALATYPAALVHIARQTDSDLTTLLEAGIPVVMEMRGCFFSIGDPGALIWLHDHGWQAEVLEPRADPWEFAIVGMRPDSDPDRVKNLGRTLLAEENWLLVRIDSEATLEDLHEARTMVFHLPRQTMKAPLPRPQDPASSPLASDTPDPLVGKIVAAVREARIDGYWSDLTSNLPTGSRMSTSQGCRDAARYCAELYTSLGLPWTYQNWSASHAPNVIATLEGAVDPQNIYIAMGHLDDLPPYGPAQGANDNASGSVMVLESARVMSCWAFRNTLRFLNATGEEQHLLGSAAYADEAYARGDNILGVINMDMPGWAGNGQPAPENLDLDYNGPSQWLADRFQNAAAKYATGLAVNPIYCPSMSISDHWSFWQKGWSALCGITDNEGYCGASGHYPYYHTANDTLPNCGDRSFFYSVVRTSMATLAELGSPFKVTFRESPYRCDSSALEVIAGDRDLNRDPSVVETAAVSLWSGAETVPEVLLLTERGPDSMLFSATMPTTSEPPLHGDGRISISSDDVVHVRYVDALDCDGASGVPYEAAQIIDCSPPVITGVEHGGVTDTRATILWATNEPSDSLVRHGTTVPPSTPAASAAMTTAHRVDLEGLEACTVYHYEVLSKDEAGNAAKDDAGGQYRSFSTHGQGIAPCHDGRIALDRPIAGCSETITAEVVDVDLNADPQVVETATVWMTSDREIQPEATVLTETGPSTATFRGSIAADPGPVAADGKIQVADQSLITATYFDANEGSGVPATVYATAAIDCAGPVITAVSVGDQPPGRVTLSWTTSEPSTGRVDYGASAALEETLLDGTLGASHQVFPGGLGLCAKNYFRITAIDVHGNASVEDRAGLLHQFQSGTIPGLILYDDFEAPSGWKLQGEWEIAPPRGLGGPAAVDPQSAWGDSRVLGYDLTGLGTWPGDYEPNTVAAIASSPDLDARYLSRVQLSFRRWLGAQPSASDRARILVSRNGWNEVWSNDPVLPTYDGAWFLQSLDISSFAAGNSRFRLGFSISSNAIDQSCGWNIDDLVVKDGNTPDAAPCGGCGAAPSFAGLKSAADLDPCGDTGVALDWEAPASWGSGGPGTYSVYRSTVPQFVPSASNRVAMGLSTRSWTDLGAPDGTAFHYLVRAENSETCSNGPKNGGVTDDNLVRLSARDALTTPVPVDLPGTVTLRRVAGTHIHLSWPPAADAASYRIYRADDPRMTGAAAIGSTPSTGFDDTGEATRPGNRFYLVKAVNACGAEGP